MLVMEKTASTLKQLYTAYIYICDATETGGMPPVTTTNDTMPPPRRQQAALVRINETFLLPIRWWQCMGLETALSMIQCIK